MITVTRRNGAYRPCGVGESVSLSPECLLHTGRGRLYGAATPASREQVTQTQHRANISDGDSSTPGIGPRTCRLAAAVPQQGLAIPLRLPTEETSQKQGRK